MEPTATKDMATDMGMDMDMDMDMGMDMGIQEIIMLRKALKLDGIL